MTSTTLNIGDCVTWSSHGGKVTRRRTGIIVAIAERYKAPSIEVQYLSRIFKFSTTRPIGVMFGKSRPTKSYIVLSKVEKQLQLYWPFSERLEKTTDILEVDTVLRQTGLSEDIISTLRARQAPTGARNHELEKEAAVL